MATEGEIRAGEEPLVSVIIPTYQRPKLLLRALHSVQRQTYQQLEILVVDDGSQDDTASVVRRLPDRRIRYLRHERNTGLPAAARNTGIRAADGACIAFLDDDDEWHPEKLERQLGAAMRYGAAVTGAVVNGRKIHVLSRSALTARDLRTYIPDPSALLVRAGLMKELLFDETLRHGEDWDLFIRLAQRGPIGYVAAPLLRYNDGAHRRLTNEAIACSGPELERRAAVLYKHRQFFGEWWFAYHFAGTLMSYLGRRSAPWVAVRYAVRRCGLVPVAAVLAGKAWRLLASRHAGAAPF